MSNWIVEGLIASSLLMLLVLAVRRPVAAHFGPRLAYWLWLLPALRIVMPPVPAHWFGGSAISLSSPVSGITFQIAPVTAISPDMADEASANWGLIILAVWLAGAAVHFAYHFLAYRRFAKQAFATAHFMHEIDPGAIQLLTSDRVDGPLAMGLTHPAILVPLDFEWRYDAQERAFAIAHEVAHHRRGDLKVNFGALALLSLHWFNPLAHLAYRAFRIDQELACDATVVADAAADDRHAYGRALVKSACGTVPLAACALNRKQELKRRLHMMRFGPLSRLRSLMGSLCAVAFLAGGLFMTASVGANAAADTRVGRLVQDVIDDGGAAASAVIVEAGGPADPSVDAEAEAVQANPAAGIPAPVVETDEPDAQLAMADAQRDVAEAERDAQDEKREAEQDAAEAARETAADARDAAREAREDAQAARDEARQARLAAQAARRTTRAAMPAPPAPPAAPAPPRYQVRDGDCGCDRDDKISVHSIRLSPDRLSYSVMSKGELRKIVRQAQAATAARMPAILRASMLQARAQILADEHIPAQERARAVAEIDRQIDRIGDLPRFSFQ
jgi:bla regulator protein blaR1